MQHTVIEGVHKAEPIKRICYIPDNDLIISGSASSKTSVIIIDRKGNKKPYYFKLAKVCVVNIPVPCCTSPITVALNVISTFWFSVDVLLWMTLNIVFRV